MRARRSTAQLRPFDPPDRAGHLLRMERERRTGVSRGQPASTVSDVQAASIAKTISLALALALLALGALAACGASASRPSVVPPDPPAALGPLPDPLELFPDGVDTLLLLHPRELFSHSATGPVADALLPPDRRDAIERRRGVRVAELERLWIADYGDAGFIAIAVGVTEAPTVVRAIALGMNTVEWSSDQPFVRRTGYLGTERRDVVALDPRTLLFAGAEGPLVAALLERARGGAWPSGRTAVAGQAGVAELMDETGDEPLRMYVPHHLGLDPATGPGLLLSRQTALSLVMRPAATDAVLVRVTVHGELPESANDNFRQWVQSIGQSSLGAIVGIAEGLPTLRVEAEAQRAAISEQLPSQGLVRAIRLLLADRVGEALDLALPRPSAPAGAVGQTGEDAASIY